MGVTSGECARCERNALLYPATDKNSKKVGLCWECREFIKQLMRRKK